MKQPTLQGNFSLMLVQVADVRPPTYSLETTAALAEVHPEMLRYYCRLGLLGEARTNTETDPTFDDDALYELRQFEAYRRNHGLDRSTLRMICQLRREVERLSFELRFARGA